MTLVDVYLGLYLGHGTENLLLKPVPNDCYMIQTATDTVMNNKSMSHTFVEPVLVWLILLFQNTASSEYATRGDTCISYDCTLRHHTRTYRPKIERIMG